MTRSTLPEGYGELRALTVRLLEGRHGFAVFPPGRAEMVCEDPQRWLAVARVDGTLDAQAIVARLSTSPLDDAMQTPYWFWHLHMWMTSWV